jgi:hypothetical protein
MEADIMRYIDSPVFSFSYEKVLTSMGEEKQALLVVSNIDFEGDVKVSFVCHLNEDLILALGGWFEKLVSWVEGGRDDLLIEFLGSKEKEEGDSFIEVA